MATTACTEANILRELEEITNPYNFGLQLGIDSKVLDRIDRDHRNDVERQRSEIIKYWYRNTKKSERTWGRIADAIGRLGGHSNLEAELRQLGTTPTGPGTNLRIPTTPGAASPTAFSDALPPTELVSWLSQQFQAKGLTLDPSLGKKLTDNDINGAAFMDLKDSDLVEMGFTKGQRMNIIQLIKGSKEENDSSQTKAASQTVKATSGAPGNVRSFGKGSGPAPKKRKMDSESDVTIDDLNAVIDALWKARAKWKNIGICIGVDAGTLDTMKGSDNDCLRETLSHWLKGVYDPDEPNSKPRTWHTLIEALRTKTVNEAAMADKLEEEKYPDTDQGGLRSADRGSESASKRMKTNRGLNDKPSMDQLFNFKDGTSKINIPQRIGIKYSNFGTQLLRGDFGYIRSLEQQYSRDSEKINTVILEEWLGGKGKEPKSWATLVEVLDDIELGELARQIKEGIMHAVN